ncbi:PLP-dependent aminotransferase family protein [Phenylobacterium deserti]|uniref:PLP-dependent aminotransferase family protein n=1 Tax=Phenylobacterium deserti TaxID=1914756 RepID=A0A328ARJ3_9CAUL|nr:PLP-dependent aminotransferase family protein [Phenylobacterium deserti]RAK57662.1 PLP-dependent aminotransferase family protein [Phenylobacterium deserti]
MTPDHPSARWLRRVDRSSGRAIYLSVLDALQAAIREGELQPGDQLPPQRAVAGLLGVDLTTVTRAYNAARERGLLDGAVGRGTFVRARPEEDEGGRVDLSMNLPPPPDGVSLANLLKDACREILERTDAATLMAYHPGAGTLGQKAAGAAWLRPALGDLAAERVLVCAGAQVALAAILSAFTHPGDQVVVEPLTYPGFKLAAQSHGLNLTACPVDGDGLVPEALEEICARRRPAAIYTIPTAQNPTAVTLQLTRRAQIAQIAQRHGIWIIEDDPYSRLFDRPVQAIAALAPDRCFHLATLAKCLTPGLRTAFIVPPPEAAEPLARSLRALSLMPAPLMTAVAASWIREGQAERLLAGVRAEARARRALAADLLPQAMGEAESIHIWLDLPSHIHPDRLQATAQASGVSLVTAEAFAVETQERNGLRISLGGPARRAVLTTALEKVARLLDGAQPS